MLRFTTVREFSCYKLYENFIESCRINVPEKFNLDFDVVDETAYISPDKKEKGCCNHEREKKKYLLLVISKEKAVAPQIFLNLLG
jgi:acetyl-CoA synthetase